MRKIISFSLLILILISNFLMVYLKQEVIQRCDLLVRYISDINGVGVYAGKDFPPGMSTMQKCIGIPVPLDAVPHTELVNYIEGYNSTHGLVLLGHGMLYNHLPSSHNSASVRKFPLQTSGQLRFITSSERSSDVIFESNGYIQNGEQLFTSYGNDWFRNRDQVELEFPHKPDSLGYYRHLSLYSDLESGVLPGCPTLLSKYQGSRLVATLGLRKGQIIEVARALLLVERDHEKLGVMAEVLWWRTPKYSNVTEEINRNDEQNFYKVAKFNKSFTYSLLLSGNGALYSANGDWDGMKPNVEYSWWSPERTSNCNNNNDRCENQQNSSCLTSPSSSDNCLVCDTKMFVKFTAKRNIGPGEPLIVDLHRNPEHPFIRYVANDFANVCL
jgi:hypothetical protein